MTALINDPTVAPLEPSSEEPSRYLGGARGRAVATLTRAILDQEVLVLLTGSAGVGKTVVLNAVVAALAVAAIRVIRLSNPSQRAWGQRDLAHEILGGQFEDPASPEADLVVGSTERRDMAAKIAERVAATAGEARVVIAVDDAHTLTDDAIELLLLLASPVRGSQKPPQLVLSGRGEFWQRDRLSELAVIARLAERVILDPLTGQEAVDYIMFRLKRAGTSNLIISSDALTEILRYSNGLPARIDKVLEPADSIRVCRGSRVLTAEMVEAGIATMVSAPATPFSDTASMMFQTDPQPSADWIPPPQPIRRTSLPSHTVSPASPIEGSIPVPASRRPVLDPDTPLPDRGPPSVDPAAPILVAPMLCSPSARMAPASGNAVVPLQVETPSSAATALVIRTVAPGRQRSGRAAIAASKFVIIIGTLACVVLLSSIRLTNTIIWPRSSGLTGGSDTRTDRPLSAPSAVQSAVQRGGVQEVPTIASLADRSPTSPAPTATDRRAPTLEPGPPQLAQPATAASVAAVNSGGLPDTPTTVDRATQMSPPNAGASPVAPPVVAVLSPEMLTFLLGRGNLMLRQGDVSSARSSFEQAANAGSREGALGAAKTLRSCFSGDDRRVRASERCGARHKMVSNGIHRHR